MKIKYLIFAAMLSMAAIQPPSDENLPPEETRIPPGHYCKRSDVTITPRETRAHHCDCKMSCTVDEATGEVTTHETINCMAWCEKNGRRCTCHVEEPCPKEGDNALMDMYGHVVAMRKR